MSSDLDELWPRVAEYRYRIYARVGHELTVLATCPTAAGVGQAIVTLHEDAKAAGRRLIDEGRIGVLDVMPGGEAAVAGDWIISLWDRRES